MRTLTSGVRGIVDVMNKFTWTAEVLWRKRREKGRHGHSLNERTPRPLPGQAFIAFLGALHQGRSSFIMRRFALGYFFRLLLIDNKEKNVADARGKSG